jgi:hypothetical protein
MQLWQESDNRGQAAAKYSEGQVTTAAHNVLNLRSEAAAPCSNFVRRRGKNQIPLRLPLADIPDPNVVP